MSGQLILLDLKYYYYTNWYLEDNCVCVIV